MILLVVFCIFFLQKTPYFHIELEYYDTSTSMNSMFFIRFRIFMIYLSLMLGLIFIRRTREKKTRKVPEYITIQVSIYIKNSYSECIDDRQI